MKGIRQVVFVFVMGGLFGVPPLFAQAGSPWIGLWRLTFPETPDAMTYWAISEENSKVSIEEYTGAWRPETITVSKIDESTLSTSQQNHGMKILITATRQGDAFSGTSKLIHVQGSREQPVRAVRLVKANHWDPLEGIRRIQDQAGVADVSSMLRKAALASNLQKFTAAWDSEIGGPYYVFLETFWDPDPARKSEKLRQLYQLLRTKQFDVNLKTALAARAEVQKLVKDKQPSFFYSNPTVVVPSLSSADVSLIDVLDGKIHVKLEVPATLSPRSQARLKWLIAREDLKLVFLVSFPLQMRAAPVNLIREGITGYLAAQLLGISLPAVLDIQSARVEESLARLDTYRKALAQQGYAEIEKNTLASPGDSLTGPQIVDMVSYKFGEQVLKRFKAEEVVKLDRIRLLELANDYLRSGSGS